jgi:signal transduction histidine kinase/CHASE1-domain containing sensor protein
MVAAVSLGITALTWYVAGQRSALRDNERFEHAVEAAVNLFDDRLNRQTELLQATKGFVLTQPDLDFNRFEAFAEAIGLAKAYPGLTGLGWSAKLNAADATQAIARFQGPGQPPIKLWGLGLSPELHAILALQPNNPRNAKAFGFNMFSDPVRRRAMEKARDTGDAAATQAVHLVQEVGKDVQPGFLIYVPVYYGTGIPNTLAERRRRLRGFVYSPFRAHDLLSRVFIAKENPELQLKVFDSNNAKGSVLFSDTKHPLGATPLLKTIEDVKVAGQTWSILFESSPYFENSMSRKVLFWIPLIGVLVSLLLTGLSWRQNNATRELQEQAKSMRRREFHQKLLASSGSLLNESLDYERTLAATTELAVPSFADWCAVDLVSENGEIKRLAIAHADPAKVQWARELQERWPPDPNAPTGVPHVVRTGANELYKEIPAEMLQAAAAVDPELEQVIEKLALRSAMIVAIRARGRTLGAISYVWAESGKNYDEEDLRVAEEIASRAGMAIDNSRLYREAQQERSEVQRLNHELEKRVEERTAELMATNYELEAFAYSVSHDLRAPLRSVDGFSRSLLEDYGDKLDETGHDYIARVRAATKRMDELISALLSLSRITRAEMKRDDTDMTALAERAAVEAKAAYGPNVEVVVQPGMTAHADARMISAVFDNLISNGVKFSSKSEAGKVEVGFDGHAFFVRDNGVGFNPAYMSKLFAPFERLHSSKDFAGSGIGLATVQRIVKRHGGQVWAESEEGKGATFFFTLSA